MSDLRTLAEAAIAARGTDTWTSNALVEAEEAFYGAANPRAVIGLLDKVAAAASRWQWTVATTPGGGAILSYRAPGQSGFALIASALPRPDGMLTVRIAGQAHTPADDLPAALATIRAVLGGDVPEIPNERSPK